MKINLNYKYDVKTRILSRSTPTTNGCIEYQPNLLKHKYGLISITVNGKRKSVPAHRALWMAVNDRFDLPTLIQIRHKCDNARCVNECHLIPGSAKDNNADMLERGRRSKNHKLHTRIRKLTNEQILDIRCGTERPGYYCRKYELTAGYVSKIKNMKAKTLVV